MKPPLLQCSCQTTPIRRRPYPPLSPIRPTGYRTIINNRRFGPGPAADVQVPNPTQWLANKPLYTDDADDADDVTNATNGGSLADDGLCHPFN